MKNKSGEPATPEMIKAGKSVLLTLVAEDDIKIDPDRIVTEIWEAMKRVRSGA